MKKLTAVLIAKNAEATLERTLASVAFCDEIVVLDSGSSDRTAAIAALHGARVHLRTFDSFAAQKNHAVSLASHDWILSIDADEAVTPELAAEIRRVLADGPDAADTGVAAGYRIPRRTFFMGQALRFGGHQSDRPVRFFRRSAGSFAGKIHEEVRVEGRVDRLRSPLLHYTTLTAKDYLRKLNHYTDLEVESLRDRSQDGGQGAGRRSDIWLRPIARFGQKYFLQLGLADGWAGFVYAFLSGYYEFVRLAKFWNKPGNLSANI